MPAPPALAPIAVLTSSLEATQNCDFDCLDYDSDVPASVFVVDQATAASADVLSPQIFEVEKCSAAAASWSPLAMASAVFVAAAKVSAPIGTGVMALNLANGAGVEDLVNGAFAPPAAIGFYSCCLKNSIRMILTVEIASFPVSWRQSV